MQILTNKQKKNKRTTQWAVLSLMVDYYYYRLPQDGQDYMNEWDSGENT